MVFYLTVIRINDNSQLILLGAGKRNKLIIFIGVITDQQDYPVWILIFFIYLFWNASQVQYKRLSLSQILKHWCSRIFLTQCDQESKSLFSPAWLIKIPHKNLTHVLLCCMDQNHTCTSIIHFSTYSHVIIAFTRQITEKKTYYLILTAVSLLVQMCSRLMNWTEVVTPFNHVSVLKPNLF